MTSFEIPELPVESFVVAIEMSDTFRIVGHCADTLVALGYDTSIIGREASVVFPPRHHDDFTQWLDSPHSAGTCRWATVSRNDGSTFKCLVVFQRRVWNGLDVGVGTFYPSSGSSDPLRKLKALK